MKNQSQNVILSLLPGSLGLLLLLITWYWGDGGLLLLIVFSALIIGIEYSFRFLNEHFPTPYLGMFFSPLLLLHYSSVNDFRIRLACFFMLLYILTLALKGIEGFSRITAGKTGPWRLWLISILIFMLAATIFYARGIQLSGDEPHYLMITQSLVEDGDFNLFNNLESKTYWEYLPSELRFHGTVQNGKYYSFHLPGISFLLLPFFFLFKLLGGLIPANLYFRLCAALINSFFALGFYSVLKMFWPDKNNNTAFFFFLSTFPLVFHAIHLYPELPAATLLIFAYIFSRSAKNKYFTAGLFLAFIPWLHLKYVPPTIIMAVFIIAEIFQHSGNIKKNSKNLLVFLAWPAVSFALLVIYSKLLYGSYNPGAISPEKNFFSIPFKFQIETLLSFFLDQRDGLLIYAPVFLLLFLVLKKEIRTTIRDFSLLTAIFLSYILFHAFTTLRGGYSPAARPTVFVLWVMAIFLSAYYRQTVETGKILFRFLAGLTCFATVWLFYYPLFLYQPVTREVSQRASSLLLFLGSTAVNLPSLFPSFLKKTNNNYLPNWIWLAILAITLVFIYVRKSKLKTNKTFSFAFLVLGLLLLFCICFIPHVQLQTRYSRNGFSFYCNSRNFSFIKEFKRFKILAGQDYDLFFDLKGCTAEQLDLRLFNNNATALKVKNGKQILLATTRATESRINVSLLTLKKFTLGRKDLVHLGLEAGKSPGTTFFWLELH